MVTTAVQEASLRGQIAATERLLALQHQITETVQHQREIGTASNADLLRQQAAEAQTAADAAAAAEAAGADARRADRPARAAAK